MSESEERICPCGETLIILVKPGRQRALCDTCREQRRRQARAHWAANNREKQRDSEAKYRARRPKPDKVLPVQKRFTTPEIKRRNRVRKYGLTLEQYDFLWKLQGERCGLCGREEPRGRNWSIDHDHASGRVRGILCSPCNAGIGLLQDDPDLLLLAARYIRHHRAGPEGAVLTWPRPELRVDE